MRSLLLIRNIQVENANAISGLTYGFPAITHFLGFAHALSRAVNQRFGITLDRCAVICHSHQVKAHQPKGWGDYVFSLTRNPLTKEAKTAPFIEEGKMHMEVSLLIEANGYIGNEVDTEAFIFSKLFALRLAGGDITGCRELRLSKIPEPGKNQRRLLLSLLPGFALIDRSDLLAKHHQDLKAESPEIDMLDAWLDFAALKYKANPKLDEDEEPSEDTKAEWEYVPKPAPGYLVPIMTGYTAISPLYEPGEVTHSRDSETPFRFVESVYGVGQWLSPHRVSNIEELFWQYQMEGDYYLCKQKHSETSKLTSQGE